MSSISFPEFIMICIVILWILSWFFPAPDDYPYYTAGRPNDDPPGTRK